MLHYLNLGCVVRWYVEVRCIIRTILLYAFSDAEDGEHMRLHTRQFVKTQRDEWNGENEGDR